MTYEERRTAIVGFLGAVEVLERLIELGVERGFAISSGHHDAEKIQRMQTVAQFAWQAAGQLRTPDGCEPVFTALMSCAAIARDQMLTLSLGGLSGVRALEREMVTTKAELEVAKTNVRQLWKLPENSSLLIQTNHDRGG